jgi:hypothetical protein
MYKPNIKSVNSFRMKQGVRPLTKDEFNMSFQSFIGFKKAK